MIRVHKNCNFIWVTQLAVTKSVLVAWVTAKFTLATDLYNYHGELFIIFAFFHGSFFCLGYRRTSHQRTSKILLMNLKQAEFHHLDPGSYSV